MKKKFVLPSFIALTCMSLVGTIAASLAWLSDKANIATNSKMGGSSEGAYFAYGDGSAADDPDTPVKEGPYGIETARQLYNLAWLQYLGYFNKAKSGTITPKYFELNADIDMTGWAIPPIGTTKYPFIGQFSGKAITGYDQQGNPVYSEPHTITNLQTTNDYNQILATNKLPGRIKQAGNISDVNIVGMFGVVGELSNNIPEAYDKSVTNISDFILVKATITSTASNTLAGIVAGYVNGPISGVVVDGENIAGKMNASMLNLSKGTANYSFNDGQGHSKAFANITDYGMIGFSENDYLENVHTNTVTTYNAAQRDYKYIAQDSDDDPGWGGSIPMDEMFSHLLSYRNTAAGTTGSTAGRSVYYPTRRTIQENEAGEIISDVTSNETYTTNANNVENKSYYTNPVNYTYNYHNYEQKNSNNEVTSSYGFVWYNTQNFVCLTGEKTVWVTNACTTTRNYYRDVVDYYSGTISYRSGGTYHYLTNNGTTGVSDTTNADSACEWTIRDKKIYTTINSVNYYLSNNNGTLSLNTTGSQWEYDEPTNRIYSYTGGTTGYQLAYQNNAWSATSFTVNYALITDDGTNYLNYSGTNNRAPSLGTSESSATHWTPTSSNAFYYNYYDYYSFYISYRREQNPLMVSRTYTTYLYTYDGHYLQYNGNYVIPDTANSNWTLTTTPTEITVVPYYNNANTFVVNLVEHTKKVPATETYTEDAQMKIKPTFFPLKETNGVPAEANTGYVVSGGNYKRDQMGDIRFGKFAKGTYLPYGLDNIYTIESAGTTVDNSIDISDSRIYDDTNRKAKFEKTKTSMQAILDKSSNISGLHFVDAPINPEKTVIIPKAVINKYSYTNYEVPQDCIDFNLKEKGYINFFAGSYFQNETIGKNNSFFTLHEIQRGSDPSNLANPNPINNISEIVAIYTDGVEAHSYVYEYAKADEKGRKFSTPFMFKTVNQQSVKYELDGTTLYQEYSREASLHTGYNSTPIFESQWIGINTLRMINNQYGYAYYFDIAMNDGEYALGSVPDGGVGAYLMYLDIGANARTMFRSEIIEYFKMIDELYVHPKGITLTAISAGVSSNDKNAYCICIKTSYTGTLTMEKVVNGDVEEGRYVGTGNASQEEVSYKLPSDVVKDENGTAQTCTAQSTTTTEIKRMTFYDYDLVTQSLNKIVIEDTYVNGSKTKREVKKYNNYDIGTNTGTENPNMDLFIVEADEKVHNYKDKTGDITFSTSGNTKELMIFTIAYPDGGVVTVTFTLTVTSKQVDTHYVYEPSIYDVNVTLTKATGVTEDITALVYITYVTNTDGTYTYTLKFNGQTATITTTPIEITTGS